MNQIHYELYALFMVLMCFDIFIINIWRVTLGTYLDMVKRRFVFALGHEWPRGIQPSMLLAKCVPAWYCHTGVAWPVSHLPFKFSWPAVAFGSLVYRYQASSGHRKWIQSGPRSHDVLVITSRNVWVPVYWDHACANVGDNGSYFWAVNWTNLVFKALESCEIMVNKPSFQWDFDI